MKKLYLVDVSSMFFRAFYAIRPLTSASGIPVNAVYGFLSMTVKLLRDIHPDYMAFCFDRPEPSFRKEIDPRYKANRTDMPEDLVPQVPYIRTLSEALGIPCFDRSGYEADDLIGTLTRLGRESGIEVVIVSGDKDFAQLIRPFVSMYDTMKDVRYDEAGVMEKWGVAPSQIIDYLAIVGDSSDNVPGVAGIGAKGAQKLLNDFKTLDAIYENLDHIPSPSMRKKLEQGREDAYLSRRLVTIVCDVPLNLKIDDLRLQPIVRHDLERLLHELDFKSFARTLLGDPQAAEVSTPVGAVTANTKGDTSSSSISHVEGSVSHRLNPDGVERRAWGAGSVGASQSLIWRGLQADARQESHQESRQESHQESHHNAHREAEVLSVSVGPIEELRLDLARLDQWLRPETETWAFATERATYLAQERSGAYEVAEIAAYGPGLGELLDRKALRYKGFDIKYFCRENHATQPVVVWDQMLAAYVIKAGPVESVHQLFALYNGESLPDLPSASQILTAHLKLESHLRRKLASINGDKILFEIEQPLVPLLLGMETRGIRLDAKALQEQSENLGRDIAALEKEIHAQAGETFNIGSPKQLGVILFQKMKMPTGKKIKTGFSTDTDVLEKLAKTHPITRKVLQWRELSKLKSTYVDALPALIDPSTGRVHTTFNQALTTTGRLSSTNPNLQNIPIRTERGNQIRRAFVPSDGRVLLSADYSQIELRVLAHITNDPGLVRAFERGVDVHAATASEVFEVPLAEVNSEMRRKAKAVNFGLAYGQSAFGLAEGLGISRREATEIIERYFNRFSEVKRYMRDTIEEAKKKGYVETIFGRRRYLDELYSRSVTVRKFGERAAINAPIQGTASDLVKMAMIKVGCPEGADLLLQVHDELIFEVAGEKVDEICLEVAAKMESAAQLRVPLKVNTGSGLNWDDAHS